MLLKCSCGVFIMAMTKQEFSAKLLFWLLPWPISKILPRSLRIYYFGPSAGPPSGWYDYWGVPIWIEPDVPPVDDFIENPPAEPPPWWPPDAPPVDDFIENPPAEPPPWWPLDPYNPPPPDQWPEPPSGPTNPSDPYTPGPGPDGGSSPIVIGDTYIITSSTSDGMVFNGWGADWATVRNAGLGVEVQDAVNNHDAAVQASLLAGDYGVGRSFFSFDLSSIPSGVVIHSCILKLSGFGFNASRVSVQRGTNTFPLAFADYPKYHIDLWGISDAWELWDGLDVAINSITLNSVAIGYIQSRLCVGTVKICCREYDYDYLNVVPAARYRNGFYYAEEAVEEKPRLVIN